MNFLTQYAKYILYTFDDFACYCIIFFAITIPIITLQKFTDILLYLMLVIFFRIALHYINDFNRHHENILNFRYNISSKYIPQLTKLLTSNDYNCTHDENNNIIFTRNNEVIYLKTTLLTMNLMVNKKGFDGFWNLCQKNNIMINRYNYFPTIFNRYNYFSFMIPLFCSYLISFSIFENLYFSFIKIIIIIIICFFIMLIIKKIYFKLTDGSFKIIEQYKLDKKSLDILTKNPAIQKNFKMVAESDKYTAFVDQRYNALIFDKDKDKLTIVSDYSNVKNFINLCNSNDITLKFYYQREILWVIGTMAMIPLFEILL